MKGIHLGSYWMGENDIVYTIADDFKFYHGVEMVDLGIYYKNQEGIVRAHSENEAFQSIQPPSTPSKQSFANRLIFLLKSNPKTYRILNYIMWKTRNVRSLIPKKNKWTMVHPLRKIKSDYLKGLLDKYSPDFIVVNSAGLHFSDEDFALLKAKKIVTVCLSLSDPDVFPQNGKLYAHKFDVCFTNSKKSLLEQYPSVKEKNVHLLPFAASDRCHFPEPEQEKVFDVVVVGHARPDRLAVVNELSKKFKLGLYGDGWPNSQGTVNGNEQRKAINKGKIYLSFAKTMAGYTNVKVGLFEAMACKTVVITDYMDEVLDYFKNESEIIMYKSTNELVRKVETLLSDSDRMEKIAQDSYERFCKEHTLKVRLSLILDKIEQFKNEQH